MTPLQALERIIKNVQAYTNIDIEQELDTIAEALHVPSADEVCEELTKHFKDKVFYDKVNNDFYLVNEYNVQYYVLNEPINEVPNNILALIARFYEAQEW